MEMGSLAAPPTPSPFPPPMPAALCCHLPLPQCLDPCAVIPLANASSLVPSPFPPCSATSLMLSLFTRLQQPCAITVCPRHACSLKPSSFPCQRHLSPPMPAAFHHLPSPNSSRHMLLPFPQCLQPHTISLRPTVPPASHYYHSPQQPCTTAPLSLSPPACHRSYCMLPPHSSLRHPPSTPDCLCAFCPV